MRKSVRELNIGHVNQKTINGSMVTINKLRYGLKVLCLVDEPIVIMPSYFEGDLKVLILLLPHSPTLVWRGTLVSTSEGLELFHHGWL